jgi:multidrug efflux pump subunit AcrA (membrane-fusion protein)
VLWLSGLVVAFLVWGVAALIVAAVWATRSRGEANANDRAAHAVDETDADSASVPVKTIRPKVDPSFALSVEALASVEPFFTADLKAPVAGPVKFVRKDVGDRVSSGELLLELDVPDLEDAVLQKQAVVEQRIKEWRLAKVKIEVADAAVEVAKALITQKDNEKEAALATRNLKEDIWHRFEKLVATTVAEKTLAVEAERDYRAAYYAFEAAKAAVEKARADCKEAVANFKAANVDVELKLALIEVARRDRDRASALADYTKITAPFDGEIVRRMVDPGTFVQNATTAQSPPLLSVARTDLVTIVARVPDKAAPFVTLDTEAIVQLDELPKTYIRGKITRFPRSIRDKDRTMRVEMDLYNDGEPNYSQFRAKGVGCFLGRLGSSSLAENITLAAASRSAWGQRMKAGDDPMPLMPTVTGKPLRSRRLLPGMSGTMRLLLNRFANSYLVPSSAVFSKAGRPHIMEVIDGTAHLVPVHVDLNDGKLARIRLIVQDGNPKLGVQEVLSRLTGEEVIVASRQQELREGQAVQPCPEDWQP